MTVTVKVLIPAKTAEAAQTRQYTATAVTTIIDKFTATNYSGSAATISVHLPLHSPATAQRSTP